jgi:hypothetical protein
VVQCRSKSREGGEKNAELEESSDLGFRVFRGVGFGGRGKGARVTARGYELADELVAVEGLEAKRFEVEEISGAREEVGEG